MPLARSRTEASAGTARRGDVLRAEEELLTLALSRPAEALERAREVLDGRPGARAASVARQAIGIVLRDFGDVQQGVVHLRGALRNAITTGDPDREADVRCSLGVALVMAGRTRPGLAQLERGLARRRDPARVGPDLVRRAHVFWLLGRDREALADAGAAVSALTGTGLTVWLARAHTHRAMACLALGDLVRADREYRLSEELFDQAGQRLEFADARQERAAVAFAHGDLPAALARLDEAERIIDELGVFEPELVINRCAVLLTAGLVDEAREQVEAAVERSVRQRGSVTRRAELLHAAALAARAGGDLETAYRRSQEARTAFRRQNRPRWAARAELVLLESRYGRGERTARLLARTVELAADLDRTDPARANEAHLLAGRTALARGDAVTARDQLLLAARSRGPDLHAAIARHVARALLHRHEGRTRAMLASCTQGLALIDLHLRRLGATELRTQATALGSELAAIALRHAAGREDGRQLLVWSERWRSVALAVPPVRPQTDSALVGELAALRSVTRRLERSAVPSAELVLEHRRREDGVRRLVRHTPAPAGDRTPVPAPAQLHRLLADGALLELIDLDGTVRALVVRGGRIRSRVIGPVADADRAVEHALFALRGAARIGAARHGSGGAAAGFRPDLDAIGARLERCLVGDVLLQLVGDLPADAPLVVVPTGRWHAVPWSLMPSLRDRAVSVAPSATAWMRARRLGVPARRRVVLVGGPGLSTGRLEVAELGRLHPEALSLTGPDATVDRVLAAMDGAWLVHIAAHGSFRADSPLFSSVGLEDGPLTVYDLERLRVAPYRVVLSSCDSALGARSGADELLGLVSALTAVGCAGVLGSVVPIDDPSTVPLMSQVHAGLLAGRELAGALALARVGSRGTPAARAAADSFVALGI